MTADHPESWHRLHELFEGARKRPPEERAAFLDEACAGDLPLRGRVEQLLVADERAQSFLESPAALDSQPAAPPADDDERWVGRRVGRFLIGEVIASGGMGTVYRATQDHPQRTVALKVIRQVLASASLRRRFEFEVEALGQLQHPGIAQIYEAGTTEAFGEGQPPWPYFAMEFVDGPNLTEYARRNGLDHRGRLELLARVCDGVQHAHQRGVIHRDLKPANILVDGAGQPKILDFGIARATDADLRATTLRTDLGQLVGTIAYMSPEQVSGDPSRVDVRSDVYALGVVGYELLTGRLPHDVGQSVPQALRAIADQEPAALSSIDRTLRGDVDTVIAKALAKDVGQRYQSAAELAADLRRYLGNEPITARPASTFYQLRKFARRHRGVVIGLALAFAILIAGVVTTSQQAVRARAAERDARHEAEIATAVTQLTQNIFAAADPYGHKGENYTVRAALDDAAGHLEKQPPDQPEIEAALRLTVGGTYRSLGLYDQAETHLNKALALRASLFGADHLETLEALEQVARLHQDRAEYSEAQALLERILTARQGALGAEHEQTAQIQARLALVLHYQGRHAEAEPLCRAALELLRRIHGDDHDLTLAVMNTLGICLHGQDKLPEAEKWLNQALAGRRRVLGDDHPVTLITMDNLALLLGESGRAAEAEPLHREVVEGLSQAFGEDHFETLRALNNLVSALWGQDKLAEAEQVCRRTLAIRRRALGDEHLDTLGSVNQLATVLGDQGKYAQAEVYARQAAEGVRKTLGEDTTYYVMALHNVATLVEDQGRLTEAEPLYQEALAKAETLFLEGHSTTALIRSYLGKCLLAQDRYAEAEPLLLTAYDTILAARGPRHDMTRRTVGTIARLYESWGKPDEAAKWHALAGDGDGSPDAADDHARGDE